MLDTVVIVNDHAFVNGGQAKVAVETALALRARGLKVLFVSGTAGADPRLDASGISVTQIGGYDLLGDPSRFRAAANGAWNIAAARKLRKVISELDPRRSIVHVHGWAKSLSPSIGPVITGSRVPHVYTAHEFFLLCPNGGFFHYRENAICTRRPLGISCLSTNCDPRNARHKAWRVARQALLWSAGAMPRNLKDIIYLTNTQLRAMRPYLPPSIRCHQLPNFVQTLSPVRVKAEENDLYLFVGRLSPEKGGPIVAKAALRAGVSVAFAGEGQDRDCISAANPNALMLGWLEAPQLKQWLQRARCVLFPSLWIETQGLVALEAMEMGVPALVSDRTATAEFVRHGLDGLHVPTGDVQAWATAMEHLKDPEVVRAFSLSSFSAARAALDEDNYMRRLLSIYRVAAESQRAEASERNVA
jgi:glycosyltransferase involved in cell wall biosynthesis